MLLQVYVHVVITFISDFCYWSVALVLNNTNVYTFILIDPIALCPPVTHAVFPARIQKFVLGSLDSWYLQVYASCLSEADLG